MKRLQIFLISGFCAFFVSCGSRHVASEKNLKPVARSIPTKSVAATSDLRTLYSFASGKASKEINELLKDAENYLGAPYKYGGVTSSGFDCSGFTSKVFDENNLKLPRRSADQALEGREIQIEQVRPGDLIFFATAGGTKVSHVGIVHDIGPDGEVKFIHASSSKGVTISSLNEKYWNKAFLHAQRVN